jgi:transcriptional regulator with XRE-family HTH domain
VSVLCVYMGEYMGEREVVGETGPHMKAAGRRIRAWRIKAGMSQQVLADRAGIGQTTVSSFEIGAAGVSLEKLAALAEVFGCSLSDVFAEAAPKPTKYASLITAWNALPSDKHRETLLALIQQWAAGNQAASRSR